MSNEVTFIKNLNGVVWTYVNKQLFRITNRRVELVSTLGTLNYSRPQATLWRDSLFITSEDFRPLVLNRGQVLEQFNNGPKCRLSTVYRDHLICGDIIEHQGVSSASRIVMSDLRKFNVWTPQSDNEAAEYDLDTHTALLTGETGVTGLKPFGANLLIYTPHSVEIMRYTDIQNGVYNKDVFYTELGSVFKYGVLGNNRVHFFIGEDNIFQLDDNGLQSIGDGIVEYVQETMTNNISLLRRTWGYYDPTQGEVVWCYYGKDSNACDHAIMYNLYERKWYCDQIENLHAFDAAKINDKFISIDDLAGQTIDDLAGQTIDSFSASDTVFVQRLFGSANKQLYTDARPNEPLVPKPLPYVETRDEHFGDFEDVKEIDMVRLQCDYQDDDCEGIEVMLSMRQFLDDPLEYETVGLWTKNLRHKKLTFKARAGVIFRFKFQPKPKDANNGVRNFSLSGWSYGVKTTESNKGER